MDLAPSGMISEYRNGLKGDGASPAFVDLERQGRPP
jgi:hypothetical protein